MIVNYLIIDAILKAVVGFRNKDYYIPTLFFADDGLLLANSLEEIVKMIKLLNEESSRLGLSINKVKSNVVVFGRVDVPSTISGIPTHPGIEPHPCTSGQSAAVP